ncbi:MAG: class I SAM-dependent methyltransferase [Clostridiales Family XIII bacterium]|jgi:predicted O-methyltransferase YrrM|nr:class I SAM-dependent methyltransferase [Clostridiales Family XIII bacterium]
MTDQKEKEWKYKAGSYRKSEYVEHAKRIDYTELHSEMNEEERLFINGLIRETRPGRLLEIGVSRGGGTVNILNAINDMPNSKLVSIDKSDTYYGDDKVRVGDDVFKTFSKTENLTLIVGRDASEVLPVLGEKFDFVIIDTAHVHPVESLNFLCALPYMNEGAIVVFHDISLFYRKSYEGCSLATRILISALAADKISTFEPSTTYISDHERVYNIAAVQITPDLQRYIKNVFHALHIPWEYYPVDDMLNIRALLSKHYDNDCLRIFDNAERVNLAWHFSSGKTYSLDRLARIARELPDDTVFYGAGENMRYILNMYRLFKMEFNYTIWDTNHANIRDINGICVSAPDFDLHSETCGAMVITIGNVEIAAGIKILFENNGYKAFMMEDFLSINTGVGAGAGVDTGAGAGADADTGAGAGADAETGADTETGAGAD